MFHALINENHDATTATPQAVMTGGCGSLGCETLIDNRSDESTRLLNLYSPNSKFTSQTYLYNPAH